jgi:hypothetical protein
LYVRIADHEGRIYLDLADTEWQVVEISADGWAVVADSPVRFRRPKGMQALPKPVPGGSIAQLRKFINVGSNSNWVLCVSWLLAAFRATGPYPILIVQGEQGSAKSTLVKVLRRIIDPSAALVRTPPRDDRDLMITAANSWVTAYDNLSDLPQWLSDALCRLATGGGFSTRELYSDSEEVFFDAMRPVVLNGIDHLASRADLADRALILHLPSIDKTNRRDEAQLYSDFQRDLPQILGAMLTAASAALRWLPETILSSKPRMADFALWATAAEEGLGFTRGTFMNAYEGNRAEAIQETLEADDVGSAIVTFVDSLQPHANEQQWEGTCKELLHELERLVAEPVKKSRSWPKSPRALSGRLRRLVTFLREANVHITFHAKSSKGQRLLSVKGTAKHLTAATATTGETAAVSHAMQSITTEPGGGWLGRVAVDDSNADQPPPQEVHGIGLNRLMKQKPAAVVAIAAVSCTDNPRGSVATNSINSCAHCGPVEWEWVRKAWVCPNCGEPAGSGRVSSHRAETERFEL